MGNEISERNRWERRLGGMEKMWERRLVQGIEGGKEDCRDGKGGEKGD